MKNNTAIWAEKGGMGMMLLIGFLYRIFGISTNHSFWTDEAFVASVARNFNDGKLGFTEIFTMLGARYQPLYVLLMSLSFRIFGANEYAARLPSVMVGTIGILFVYLLAKSFSNKCGGFIAAFLYTFSQLQLAHATQAKPYTIISVLFLAMIYVLNRLTEKRIHHKDQVIQSHGVIILLLVILVLLHASSILFLGFYGTYLLLTYKDQLFSRKYRMRTLGALMLMTGASIMYLLLIGVFSIQSFLKVNNVTYVRELFAHQYLFMTLPAIFGAALVWKKHANIMSGIVVWSGALFFSWTFIHYSKNIRYLIPFFTLLPIFFGVFFAKIAETYFKKQQATVAIALCLFLFVGGSKIARKPSVYYSPNADLFADVQNADYKSAYSYLKMKFPNYKNMTIYNDVGDGQPWFLEDKPSADAYFMKGVTQPHGVNGVMIYGTLEDFIKQKDSVPQGLLIVEDWESILPEDIKQYAKKNMKLEYRVESLEVSPTDKWPLELYSWGMD